MSDPFEIFLVGTPGLEAPLLAETLAAGFAGAKITQGGVTFHGAWPDVWRANLTLRGATRVLARIGSFRVFHLAQLDKRSRKFPWGDTLRPDLPIKVEVTCKQSKVYHAGAATQRIETALTGAGYTVSPDAALRLMARIEDDLCTFSIDTSGESLHKRGHKEAVGKAPMRETMAAMFLREAGFEGTEPVLDPMCGSGTFVIEAAEMAAGLLPGRSRTFGFEKLASFDSQAWADMKTAVPERARGMQFHGSDRDAGAVRMCLANAERAGVSGTTVFSNQSVAELERPDGPPGLVIVNPPYGARIGNKKLLFALHAQMGTRLMEKFAGWRVAIVTSDASLAKATGLPLHAAGPFVAHGGLKIRLHLSKTLK